MTQGFTEQVIFLVAHRVARVADEGEGVGKRGDLWWLGDA